MTRASAVIRGHLYGIWRRADLAGGCKCLCAVTRSIFSQSPRPRTEPPIRKSATGLPRAAACSKCAVAASSEASGIAPSRMGVGECVHGADMPGFAPLRGNARRRDPQPLADLASSARPRPSASMPAQIEQRIAITRPSARLADYCARHLEILSIMLFFSSLFFSVIISFFYVFYPFLSVGYSFFSTHPLPAKMHQPDTIERCGRCRHRCGEERELAQAFPGSGDTRARVPPCAPDRTRHRLRRSRNPH